MLTGNGLHNTSCSTVKMDTPSSFIGKMEIIQIRYDSAAAKENTYVLFKKRLGSISAAVSATRDSPRRGG